MKKITTISMFVLALLPYTSFAQYEDDNELKFLKKYCADRVDADEYILGFSERSFENITIGDKELGDIILLYAESFDDFWPTYSNLESWFMNPITELGRQRTVSFMHIIRSKENYLRANRPEVISALKQTSFPWNDELFFFMIGKANQIYKSLVGEQKQLAHELVTHLTYSQFISGDAHIDVGLIDYALFSEEKFLDLALVFSERMKLHQGNFKYVNQLFTTSPEDQYEKHVQLIKNKNYTSQDLVLNKQKKQSSSSVQRDKVMDLISNYNLQNGIDATYSNTSFTNGKINSLLFIINQHGGTLTSEDVELLFGKNSEGGLYQYLYDNIEWQNNYEDFLILTLLCLYQPHLLNGRDNYLAVIDGAVSLKLIGSSALKGKMDLKKVIDKSSFVDNSTSLYLYNELLFKSQVGYSLLKNTLMIRSK